MSTGYLTENLTQIVESRLTSFAQSFSESNCASVEQAVKKVRRENYTCVWKENQWQLGHEFHVLDKLDDASKSEKLLL